MPWFIFLFCLAAVVNTYGPQEPRLSQMFFQLGRQGLTVTLFLIGTGISRATLQEVGWRPLAQGVLLWLLVGVPRLYFRHIGAISRQSFQGSPGPLENLPRGCGGKPQRTTLFRSKSR